MAIITPTTELEAVNILLQAIGESPTSSLTGEVGVDVVTAQATLSEVTKAVQSEGWQFNTEYDYPLSRSNNGEIGIPVNALSVDVDKRKYYGIDPVQRGSRLYDRKNHTYQFDEDLTATVVFGFGFEDMPQVARNYVTYRAARLFQDNSLGSNDLHRFKKEDEVAARIRLMEEQAEDEDLNFLTDDPQFQPMWRH